MQAEEPFGYTADPPNAHGIIHARTTGALRSWEFPRTDRALAKIESEWGSQPYPGNYILFLPDSKRVYIGEAKDLIGPLRTHFSRPDKKFAKWHRAFIFNDGRSAKQSDFTDPVVRRALEYHTILLFRANQYTILAQGDQQEMNPTQQAIVSRLLPELDHLLINKRYIERPLAPESERQVFPDELQAILKKSGRTIGDWSAYEAIIDGQVAFIRKGSPKPQGWQVTFRNDFKKALQSGEGFLLVPRNGVLLIPMSEIKKVIPPSRFKQKTIDVYVKFGPAKVTLSYRDKAIDISRFRLLNRPR